MAVAASDDHGPARSALKTAVVLMAAVVLLAGCGGASQADREVCDASADLSSDDIIATDPFSAADSAGNILGQLSGFAPDDDRLVRAVDNAREDAQALIDVDNYQDLSGKAAGLEGSLSAIQSVCDDLQG